MPRPRFVASQLCPRVVQVDLGPCVHAAPVHAVGLTARLVQPGCSEVGCHSTQGLSGARFPVGLGTLLVNHHGIPEPSALGLGACFPRKSPFRSMRLTLRGGPESCAPRAHRIPVYPRVFPHSSTVLSRRTVRTWYASMPTSPVPRLKLASMQAPAFITRASSASDSPVGVR